MRIAFALALSIAVAAPAFAEPAAAPDNASGETVKPAKQKKVCRRNELAMGSRVSTGRICKTEAEWAAEDQKARQKSDERLGKI